MKRKLNKRNGFFDVAEKQAIGTAKLGVITGVGSSVAGMAPGYGLSSGFNTIASFAPISNTMAMGGVTLRQAKKLNKRKRYWFVMR